MNLCKECIHEAVCSRYAATGGYMLSCVHFIRRSTPRDENGCIAASRLPMLQDEIGVVLTREEWGTVRARLTHAVEENRNAAFAWEHYCKDPQMAAENAKLYSDYAEGIAAILAQIEAALDGPEPKEKSDG